MTKPPIKLPFAEKPAEFIGSSKRDLNDLPWPVKRAFTFAVLLAQQGKKHPDAEPMKGFGGAGVLEVVMDFKEDTYREVYATKFDGVIYVLHTFQKKSKKGRATPQKDIDCIKERLKRAAEHYKENYQSKKTG